MLIRIRHAVLVTLSALPIAACHGPTRAEARGASTASPVLAEVGDHQITVDDLTTLVNEKPPYLRARYSTPEKLKELLDDSIRFEALAEEARRRGYAEDPEVVRGMKQQMIAKMMAGTSR